MEDNSAMSISLGIRSSKVSPTHLHANSTSHTWPFSAIAELIDNSYDPDANASELWIDRRKMGETTCFTFVDNGNGMDEEKLHKMLSFGYSENVAVRSHLPIGHYGNGFKSGSMRLAKDAIVLTCHSETMSVGFLSQTYLREINADTIVVPIVTWSHSGSRSVTQETENNLDAIIKHSLFRSEEDILQELNLIKTGTTTTGTKIILYNWKELPDWSWAQCDNCLKWRRLPTGTDHSMLPDKWYCHMNSDAAFNRCDIQEEPEGEDEALKQPSYKKTYKKQQKLKRKQIEGLIDDKKYLSGKCEDLVKELKTCERKYQDRIKAGDDKHGVEIQKLSDMHEAAEKLRREKWIQDKTKRIKEKQQLIAKNKSELKKIKQIHEAELLESDERAAQRYVKMTEELRDQLAKEKESACAREREMVKQRYEKQLQQEEKAYQQQRRRVHHEIQEGKERISTQASRQRTELDKLRRQLEDNQKITRDTMKSKFDKTREEQERKHNMEIRDLQERLKVEKESWEKNYRKDRDKEIELVINRLEADATVTRQNSEKTAENKMRRIREKYDAEIRDLEHTEKLTLEKYSEMKGRVAEVEGENECFKVQLKQKDQEEMTVHGLEQGIQQLIAKNKSELKKIKQIHEAELLESDKRAAQRYVKMTEELRDQLAKEKESACAREREMVKQRYEKQLQQEEKAYQQQRRRMHREIQEGKERISTQASRQRTELDKLRRQLEDNHKITRDTMKSKFDKTREEQERKHNVLGDSASMATSTPNSTAKRSLDVSHAEDANQSKKICIKTVDGSIVALLPLSDKENEDQSIDVVNKTLEEEDINLNADVLKTQMSIQKNSSNKISFPAPPNLNTQQPPPSTKEKELLKLKNEILQLSSKFSGLQQNIHTLIKIIVPNVNLGDPESIGEVVSELISANDGQS